MSRIGRDVCGSYRHETLKKAFLFAGVMQSFNGKMSIEEVHNAYTRRVGEISIRTARRYMLTMTDIGILKETKIGGKRKYQWIGWPSAIH